MLVLVLKTNSLSRLLVVVKTNIISFKVVSSHIINSGWWHDDFLVRRVNLGGMDET